MKIRRLIATALADHGVDTVFGLLGDANMDYMSDYMDAGGRFVPAVHEGDAVVMADAYSRLSGRVGVASVTHGPGFTNTVTALVEAVRNGSRVLLIAGDTPRSYPTHFQHLDLSAVVLSTGAGFERVNSVGTVSRDVNRAMQRVVTDNKPVVLSLPVDMVELDADDQWAVAQLFESRPAPVDDADMGDALGIMLSANRPVILAGRGALGAREELIQLADRLGAVLAGTALAKDLFEGHPRNIGIFGNLAHPVASGAIGEADCIVAFGASVNSHTVFEGDLSRGKKVIHVDHRPSAFGWYTRPDAAVLGDAARVAGSMNRLIDEAGHRGGQTWASRIEEQLQARSPGDDFLDRTGAGTVDMRTAAIALDRILPADRVVVSDVGRFNVGVWPYVKSEPGQFLPIGAFGSIGLGISGAIGAAIARPEKLTVALIGDGGFMMHMSEFTTAVREELPLLVVILNDNAYGAEYYRLVNQGINPAYATTRWPEMVPLAKAMGADGATVRTLSDLEQLREIVVGLKKPFLVDVKLDPDVNVIHWA